MEKQINEIIIYENNGKDIEVRVESETVWLNLNQISALFGKDKSNISRHIKNIYKEGELVENSVVAKNATTASDGKTYQVEYYNLDMIISIGYRVNSKNATAFSEITNLFDNPQGCHCFACRNRAIK
ncbi:MAG: virulence RhuM family protein [Rickettsiales bacterium]|nr:virulence RhuM family protein [Rickettsiales bacterium]